MKRTIKCPYHQDSNASAAIFTRPNGSEWIHCLGCGTSQLINKGETMKIDDQDEYFDYDEEIELAGRDFKQCLNEVELLEKLEVEKGITAEMISNLKGYITDKGYLGIPYGAHNKVVYRALLDQKPRFINEGGAKGLMGEENIPLWGDVYLVEGVTDYLLMNNIYHNTVCSFGAELSDEQAYLLRGRTVFILFDRDFAGYKGAKLAASKLKEYGAIPIILELFEDDSTDRKIDVNWLLHKYPDKFKHWLNEKIREYLAFDTEYLKSFMEKKPLKFYDTDIPGLQFTEGLYVITGVPGVGKTTMGISLLDRFSSEGGSILYCNYDLPKDQIIARLASRNSKLSWSAIESNPNSLGNPDQAWLKQRLKFVKIMNRLTIDEIKHCRKYYSHIIIDYLQRIPNSNSDQRVGLETIMDELSDMASNYGTVVVGISRMPAASYNNSSGHIFSGTAAIEYHAQGAILLNKTDEGTISCEVRKNTRGKTGVHLMKIDYPHQKLTPIKLNDIAIQKEKELFQWDNKE